MPPKPTANVPSRTAFRPPRPLTALSSISSSSAEAPTAGSLAPPTSHHVADTSRKRALPSDNADSSEEYGLDVEDGLNAEDLDQFGDDFLDDAFSDDGEGPSRPATNAHPSNTDVPTSAQTAQMLESDSDSLLASPPPRRNRRTHQPQAPSRTSTNSGARNGKKRQTQAEEEDGEDLATSEDVIPHNLLAHLFYRTFQDKSTKIDVEAMHVLKRYVETFAKEAIARAALERQEKESADEDELGDGRNQDRDIHLEVTDLEILVPQLLLDF